MKHRGFSINAASLGEESYSEEECTAELRENSLLFN
jgi:hypothetical protein